MTAMKLRSRSLSLVRDVD